MIEKSRYTEHDRLKLVILGHFLPFYPLNIKKSKFLRNEKIPGDINILHKCTKIHNHMMFDFWDRKWDRQIFLLNFGQFFALLAP